MPVCFQLFRKTEPQKAVVFQRVDEELCKHFNVPVDEHRYYCGWYDGIGFRIATGMSFEAIRNEFVGDFFGMDSRDSKWANFYWRRIEILDYLAERFNTTCWREL